MRRSRWPPSIVPAQDDHTVYLVADDFRKIDIAWPEANYEGTDFDTVIQNMLSGEYSNPIRVVAFNTYDRWCKDVSVQIAHELRRRCDSRMRKLPASIANFVERCEERDRWQTKLRGLK